MAFILANTMERSEKEFLVNLLQSRARVLNQDTSSVFTSRPDSAGTEKRAAHMPRARDSGARIAHGAEEMDGGGRIGDAGLRMDSHTS